jgi:uncharacterized membrane protein
MIRLSGKALVASGLTAICCTLSAGVDASSAATSAAQAQKFTVYAVAKQVQYVDYSDGITRAKYQNPFNVDSKAFTPVTKGKTSTLPGNSVFFSFDLYQDSSLKKSIGTATYTCTFNFDSAATCDGYYDVGGSTMFASGPVDFTTLHSTLAVTGGTGKFAGLNGEVISTGPGSKPAAKNESRLDFDLLG